MTAPEVRDVIPDEVFRLRDRILATTHARGVALEERVLRLERGHPILHLRLGDRALRGCRIAFPADPSVAAFGYAPNVVTVHGSGDRSSRMWPRQRDGNFKIEAIVDHVLRLVEVEVSRPVPELVVPQGVPAGLSGLHVLYLAGVHLGALPVGSKPESLLERLDAANRVRIEAKIARGGLIEADIRLMDRSNGYSFGRSNKLDHDPFNVYSDRALPVLVLGRSMGAKVERRFVLILDDHDGSEFTLADPAGDGLVKVTRDELTVAWKLGAKKGVLWAGHVWVRRRELTSTGDLSKVRHRGERVP